MAKTFGPFGCCSLPGRHGYSGPPFRWPLTWQRYLAMAQLGKKPGQQMEERTTVFESWEQNKDFIMTKEPRWLGALMRYLRDRGGFRRRSF